MSSFVRAALSLVAVPLATVAVLLPTGAASAQDAGFVVTDVTYGVAFPEISQVDFTLGPDAGGEVTVSFGDAYPELPCQGQGRRTCPVPAGTVTVAAAEQLVVRVRSGTEVLGVVVVAEPAAGRVSESATAGPAPATGAGSDASGLPAVPRARGDLPFTGAPLLVLAVAGVAAAVGGTALLRAVRRRV